MTYNLGATMEELEAKLKAAQEEIMMLRHKGAPTIRWIDNSEDVARKGK